MRISAGRWSRHLRGSITVALVAIACGGLSLAAQEEGGEDGQAAEAEAADAATTTQGVFTEDQATRGEDVFYNICAECHFEEDFGGPFIQSWAGASVKDLVDEIVATMPEDNPGGMPVEQYLDVVTFMFKLNGMPTGEDELIVDDMDAVEIAFEIDP